MAIFNLGPSGRKFNINKGDILIRTTKNGNWSSVTAGDKTAYKLDIKANGNWDLIIKKSCVLKFKVREKCDFFLVGGGGAGHGAIGNYVQLGADTGGYGGNGGWYKRENNITFPIYKEIPIIIGIGGDLTLSESELHQQGYPTIMSINDTIYYAEGGYGPYGSDSLDQAGLSEEEAPSKRRALDTYPDPDPRETIDGTILNATRTPFYRKNESNKGKGGYKENHTPTNGQNGSAGFYAFNDSTNYPTMLGAGGGQGGGANYNAQSFSDGGTGGDTISVDTDGNLFGKGGGKNYLPTNGKTNTGDGGGGAGVSANFSTNGKGAKGGSGVVFIRNAR